MPNIKHTLSSNKPNTSICKIPYLPKANFHHLSLIFQPKPTPRGKLLGCKPKQHRTPLERASSLTVIRYAVRVFLGKTTGAWVRMIHPSHILYKSNCCLSINDCLLLYAENRGMSLRSETVKNSEGRCYMGEVLQQLLFEGYLASVNRMKKMCYENFISKLISTFKSKTHIFAYFFLKMCKD